MYYISIPERCDTFPGPSSIVVSMPTETTAVRYHVQPLRRRTPVVTALNIQPTASTSFSADSCKNLATDTNAKMKEIVSEDESHDDLDDSSDGGSPEPPEAASSQTSPMGPSRAPVRAFSHQEDPMFLPDSRPWYQSNFPILLAVVSPLGNWLTGTDYIKNLFLIALVVFYLHQLIEGPSFLFFTTNILISP